MALTWLGHSTVVVEPDGAGLIADPLLSRHACLPACRHQRPEPVQADEIDAIFMSRVHHDHYEPRLLRELAGKATSVGDADGGPTGGGS